MYETLSMFSITHKYIILNQKKYTKDTLGFTLVELVVVATILAILWAVWFSAYTWYIDGARDTNRIVELWNIRSWLQTYLIDSNNGLPLPGDYVTIQDGVEVIWYQWYAWQKILDAIDLKKWWTDPLDGSYYSYYVSESRNYFQLLWFLEEQNSELTTGQFFPTTNAVDYGLRYPTVTWESLWIMVWTWNDTNIPIQELDEIVTTNNGILDVWATSTEYTAIIKDDYLVTWDSNVLWVLASLATTGWQIRWSCKELIDSNPGLIWKDGTYLVSPDWVERFEVECDMTVDGWGWTRYTENGWGVSYNRLELSSNYISEADELFFAYKRLHTWDDWYAYKFTDFSFTNCSTLVWDPTNLRSSMKTYIDHITNGTLWTCARSWSTGKISIEKIVYGKYIDDACINWTMNAINRATYFWSTTTPDWRIIWRIQNRISNTTVLMATNWSASGRCAWVNTGSSPTSNSNSETYVYIR